MYIYNENKTVLQGPFTYENNTKDGTFSSDLIEGSVIILEYFEPDNVKEKAEISISKVVHAYRNLFPNSTKGYSSSGDCNIDVNCPEGDDWQDESNAVAMILINDDAWCSGCMVNNTNQDFTPYFLTANHCIQGQNVTNWSFRFQYKSPTCGGGDDYSYYSYYGAKLEANSSASDFALLELDNRPNGSTGITYAGWSNQNTASQSGVSITHPQGDVMKIGTYNETITRQTFLGSSDWNVIWETGTVEPGSSGGPLFNENHRIIGQVHGGNPNDICTSNDNANFGRFDVSWTHGLSQFLDPNNTGATTTNTILIPQISGTSTVCPSNSTFTIQNRPPNSTITWSKSSNLTYVSGQGTDNYTVRAYNNSTSGSGWVEANINGATFRKDIWVGNPQNPMIKFPFNKVGTNSYIETFAVSAGATNYTWSIGGGTLLWGQGTSNIALRTSSHCLYDLTVRVTSSNSCGNSAQTTITIPYDCSGGPNPKIVNPLKVSPNPSKNILNVEFTNKFDNSLTQQVQKGYTARLINYYHTTVYSQRHNSSKFSINVGRYPRGIYVLQIILNNQIYTEKIIITD